MGVIEIKGLTKYYGKVKALDDVNLTIEPNKIYGLLGRNGAGKTTLLNLLTNKIFPTKGDITIDGHTVFENDELLGRMFYMTEKNLYPEGLRVKEIFKWTQEFYPSYDMDHANTLCEKFGLNANKRIKNLSTGYKSILKIITALASNADIMLFDEPVLGLDANSRDMFYRELLASYNRHLKTIIISTHLIEEVDEILEEVIIIKKGRVILTRSLERLLSSAYMVYGQCHKVDQYISNRKYTGEQTMGGFKSAIVMEDTRDEALAQKLGLEFGMVELQKLFIALTNS